MEPKIIPFNHPADLPGEIKNPTHQVRLTDVFQLRNTSGYINEFNLFTSYFNAIPNFIHEINIDCKKANVWFSSQYKSEIKDHYYSKIYFGQNKYPEYDDIFYMLYEDLLVNFDTNQSKVRFLFKRTESESVDRIISEIRRFKKQKNSQRPEISLLINSRFGLDTKPLKVGKPKLNIEDNYNDDFLEVHQIIKKRLSKKNDKGLVLLHGKPGTGKTSYIRYLLSKIRKEIIFLPPNMASSMTSPDLITMLIDHPNSILVIEDAENIIIDREKNGNSPVSSILNISDGLLADCLNIQIICSFNTDLSKVDGALLRKGRLIAKYEFKELEVQKAQMLSSRLGFSNAITEPMTLTSIYNQEEKSFAPIKKKNPIGFI